ncbi:MAG: hypothetical protein JNK82_12625 [Myxococcaceae bacterium]|nr:hypothetical protein [Myxococcaceae bacterium]
MRVLAVCGGSEATVPLGDAAAKAGSFVVEAELKSVAGTKVVLGVDLEAELSVGARRVPLKPGERYRVGLSKKGEKRTVSCIEPKPYVCGEGAAVVPINELKETGVVEGVLRSKVVCPRCPPTGKCEPCTAKVVIDSGNTLYLHGFLEVPALGTLVRMAVRRVTDWPLGFPGIEVTCLETVAR